MRAAILLLACVAMVSGYSVRTEEEIISAVNAKRTSWTAGKNARFEGVSHDEIRGMMGTIIEEEPRKEELVERKYPSVELPESYDSYKAHPECAHPVLDQAQCGSCWAFSATEALTDRACLEKAGNWTAQGDKEFIASPQNLVSCDKTNMGCNGGRLGAAWQYMEKSGVASMTCMPYTSGHGNTGSCPARCHDGSNPIFVHASSHQSVTHFGQDNAGRVKALQAELFHNGPIQVAFTVYQDFMSYTGGVYHHVTGAQDGGHAVLLVGWGVQNGTPYWRVKNSWGPRWGLDGFFLIARGNNECGIESQNQAGLVQPF